MEATTPRLPLARMFQAPSRPLSLSCRPRTWTRSPAAERQQDGEEHEGTSTTIRRTTTGSGPRRGGHRHQQCGVGTEPQNCSRGVATTTMTKKHRRELASGGSRCTTLDPVGTARRSAGGRAHQPSWGPAGPAGSVRRCAPAAYGEDQPADDEEGDPTPATGEASGESAVVDALGPVSGERRVVELVLLLLSTDALVVATLFSPSGARWRSGSPRRRAAGRAGAHE